MIDRQALSTIEHDAATETNLFSCAKGWGHFVQTHATIYAVIGPSGGALWCCGGYALPLVCHAISPLDHLSTVDVVGIFNREFTVLNGLIQLRDGVGVLMAFMSHVIAEPRVVMDAWAFDDRNNIIFVVGVDVVRRLVAAHRSPFLTLARHEHRISWGQIAYFDKGRVWSRLADSV